MAIEQMKKRSVVTNEQRIRIRRWICVNRRIVYFTNYRWRLLGWILLLLKQQTPTKKLPKVYPLGVFSSQSFFLFIII